MKKQVYEEIMQKIRDGISEGETDDRRQPNAKFYSEFLNEIVSVKFSEREAHFYWTELMKHKYFLSAKIGRDIGIYVTALDYFYNEKKIIKEPKIIEREKYIRTERRAEIDPLTKVYNHGYLVYRAKELIRKNQQFCLLFFDIDDFKKYNDTNGHLAGDVALMEVTRVVRVLRSSGELIGRWGGEEFVVIFPDCDRDCAYKKSERLRRYIEDFPVANENILPGGELTISGGIACFPADGQNIEEIVAKADAHQYEAKSSGKNRINR